MTMKQTYIPQTGRTQLGIIDTNFLKIKKQMTYYMVILGYIVNGIWVRTIPIVIRTQLLLVK